MAGSHKRGKSLMVFIITTKCFLISLLLLYLPSSFSCLVLASDLHTCSTSNLLIETDSSNPDPVIHPSDSPYCNCKNDDDLLRKQQLQLDTLQDLVKNLSQLVSRLETRLPEVPVKVQTVTVESVHDEKRVVVGRIEQDGGGGGVLSGAVPVPVPVKVGVSPAEEAKTNPVLVTRYNAHWPEKFQFVSAVKLSSDPTCLNILPFRDVDGLSKYFAVGSDKGKLNVFSKGGDFSEVFDMFLESEEESPISSMVSFLLFYKNESLVVTGHENGVIVMSRVWEDSNGEESSALQLGRVGRFAMPGGRGVRISILEVHHVGRKRYILATDINGQITVFREDGSVYGTANPRGRPVAFLKQRLMFLTETGAGSLDLRSMKLKETDCEGLENYVVENYVFDAMDRSKAYGFTSDGHLIQTSLLGDAMNFKCRIRSKRSVDLKKPLAIEAIKGYLLISDTQKAVVYNVSTHQYVRSGGLRHLFSANLYEIIASFVQQTLDITPEKKLDIPLVASDHEKLVLLSLGNGYVAMYKSNLPVFKNEFNSILWTSPVLFFLLFLFGAWHFFAKKKEVFTSWGPDDPFPSDSITKGAPLGSVSGSSDKSSAESSRNTEIMDTRGGNGLRGPPRRYVSPPRYSGGGANSYRPGSETDARPAPVDPRYRATQELKYRGSNVEPAGIPKRREGYILNGQVVDDTN